MRFSGKKKGKRGFGSFAGGSTRGTPEKHTPRTPGERIPGERIPGTPGIGGTGMPSVKGTPGTGQERQQLYGRKVPAKQSSRTPLIILGIVLLVVIACILVAVLT